MTNTQPWEYQEQETRHETTGAIGARTPQGDIVYGPLAKQYLTPIESVPKITIPEAEAPATAPGMSLIDKTPESWILQQQEQMQARIKEQQRQLEDKQQERKGIIEQTKEFFGGVPKMETTVRDLYQEFGAVSALQRQQTILDTIMQTRQQAVTLQEQRGAAIAVLEQQGTSPYLTGQQARIAESFDRRINTLAAQEAAQVAHYQAEQGNVQQARGLVSDIVNAMTYDTNLELTKMQMFLDINRDEISMLDTSIQRDLQETTRQLENQLNQEKQERTAVLELSLTHFNAGISPNDTLENAVVKAQQWLNIQPDARVEDLMAQFPTAGIDSKDTFAEAITKIARMPQAPAGTPKAPQVFGGQQTGYFSWTQDAQGNWVPQQVVGGTSGGGDSDLNKLLSVAEAKSFGVPFGTTRNQVVGLTPGTVDEITFFDDLLIDLMYNDMSPSEAVLWLQSQYGFDIKTTEQLKVRASEMKKLLEAEKEKTTKVSKDMFGTTKKLRDKIASMSNKTTNETTQEEISQKKYTEALKKREQTIQEITSPAFFNKLFGL